MQVWICFVNIKEKLADANHKHRSGLHVASKCAHCVLTRVVQMQCMPKLHKSPVVYNYVGINKLHVLIYALFLDQNGV